MERNGLIRRIYMECPLCDRQHEVEERRRIASTLIKGEEAEYEETYYFCQNCGEDENEFTTGKMENENLLNAHNAYRRKCNLLTSDEIIEIRERYGLSQVDLAKLLGWGEATISRYESKAIQDDAYDNMLRIIKDDPLKCYDFLLKNRDKFTPAKYADIREKILSSLDSYGREYLKRQTLESEYVNFMEPSDANGNQPLDIDKLECVISYLAEAVDNLYKVKLMKLLWYADSESFKTNGKSITGLVYRHEAMGALPIGHYKIVGLENINVEEEEGFEYTSYHFLPNHRLDMSCLIKEEIEVLDRVIGKFKEYSAQDIVKYMHEERAYKSTKNGDIISFGLAKEIKAF